MSDACCIVVTIVLAAKMDAGVRTDTVHVLNRPVWLHFAPTLCSYRQSDRSHLARLSLSLSTPLSLTPGATRAQWPPVLMESGGS